MTTALERTFVLTAFRISILMAVASLVGCTVYSADPITATVVDADTGAPIEGVNVVAAWELAGGINDGAVVGYANLMETITDKNGYFHFSNWGPRLTPYGKVRLNAPVILLFKSGYRFVEFANNGRAGANASPKLKSDWDGKSVSMKRFVGTATQYEESFLNLRVAISNLEKNHKLAEIPEFMCSLLTQRAILAAEGVRDALHSQDWLRSRGVVCAQMEKA